jgi:hypothetical protein
MGLAGGNLTPTVEAIHAMHDSQAMIHGWGRGLRFPVEWMADVFEQSGLGDLGNRLHRLLQPPAGEVQQVVSTERWGESQSWAICCGVRWVPIAQVVL